VMAFHEIDNLMPMKEPADKTRMFWTLLKGQALFYFEHHLMRRLEAEESDVPDNELIELVLRDVGLEYIPKRAIHMQKYSMRHPRGLYMGINTSVQQVVERLNDLNLYLLYFPEENPKQLDQDEIIDILHQAKASDPEWRESMVNVNIDIVEMSYEESVSYFKCLEKLEKIRRSNSPNPSSLPVDDKTRFSATSIEDKLSENHKGSNMWCHYCDKNNHNTADCRAIAKFKQQKKACFQAKS
jgi:predicted RNA-binding protein associated with RNAse of E/G family